MSIPVTCPTRQSANERRFWLRADLEISTHLQSGDNLYYVVKNPVSLEYFRFRPDEYAALKLIQGATVSGLCDAIETTLGRDRPAASEMESWLAQLLAAGVVLSDSEHDGEVLFNRRRTVRAKQLRARLGNPLYIRFPGVDPERLLNWLYPRIRRVYSPPGILAVIALILFAISTAIVNSESIIARIRSAPLSEFLNVQTLVSLWLAVGVSKVLHELGHGLTCRHFGGECHDMGLLLLVFSPCMYCDTSDAWTMPNRWHRMAISGAGIYVELLIASIALLIWWNTTDGIVHQVAFALMAICSLNTVLINANPLMRFDGYYMMSDLLEIPNLRAKSRQAVQAVIDRFLIGLPGEGRTEFPSEGRLGLLLAYALTASIYRTLLAAGILWFMYSVLRPYGLGSLGVILACWSAWQLFMAPLWRTVRRVALAWRAFGPPGILRIGVSAAVVGSLLWFCLFIPLPRRISGVFIVEGIGQRGIYAVSPGRLEELPVAAGQFVRQGDVLARLMNPQIELEIERLLIRITESTISAEVYRSLDQHGEAERVEALQSELQKELEERLDQQRNLTIRADADGYVVPARRPRIAAGTNHGYRSLQKWMDAPLRQQNLGAFLPIGTHVCDLQPARRIEALLFVDQADVTFVQIGQRVQFMLDADPGCVSFGRVVEVSRAEANEIPNQLLTALGGELATDTEDERFVAHGTYYRVRTTIDAGALAATSEPGLLVSGLRGRAKIHSGSWTIWQLAVRKFNQIMEL